MNLRTMSCCGMRDLSGLSAHRTAKDAMIEFVRTSCPNASYYNWDTRKCEKLRRLNFSHVIFSEANDELYRYGESFATYIRRNKLGTVIASERRVNPNSGNRVKFWVWTLHKQNLVNWANRNTEAIRNNSPFSVARW